ncbi:MAG TPA: hypothetical protein VNI84_10730 [Pyrinomonadaceae bacterium]|nr:hypothetical protein [Pyrinomonadaceae bacterium]
MIDAGRTREVIRQYEKHGWILRRVLLSAATRERLGADEIVFGDAPVTPAEIDAAWFARPSKDGGEAWELRRLSGSPFAIIEVFDQDDEDEVRDEALGEIEKRMKNGK